MSVEMSLTIIAAVFAVMSGVQLCVILGLRLRLAEAEAALSEAEKQLDATCEALVEARKQRIEWQVGEGQIKRL